MSFYNINSDIFDAIFTEVLSQDPAFIQIQAWKYLNDGLSSTSTSVANYVVLLIKL